MIITSRGFIDAGSVGRLPTKEGATLSFGGKSRQAVMGDEGFLGHSESLETPAGIKVTLADSTAVDKKKLQEFVDQTIVYTTNNGQQFSLTNAFVVNNLELNVKDGTLEVEFQGSELISM